MRSPSGTGARPTSTRRRSGPGAGRPAGPSPRPAGALPGDLVDGLPGRAWRCRHPHAGRPVPRRLAHPASCPARAVHRPAGPAPVYGPCPRCGHPTAAVPGAPLPLCLDCASRPGGHDGPAAPVPGPDSRRPQPAGGTASQPARRPAQPDRDGDDERHQRSGDHRRLRESAHRYLEKGLWPVPAWGAGRTVNAAARAVRTARGRASIPARYMPGPARATTPGSRWPAAPMPRSTSGSARAAATRPGT